MRQIKLLMLLFISVIAFSCSKDKDDDSGNNNLLLGYIPQEGLVTYYTFSGNANDISAGTSDGELFGPILSSDRFSVSGQAYDFSNDFIQVPYNASFNTGSELTVSVWVNIDDVTQSQKILGRTNYDFDSGFILGVEDSNFTTEVWDNMGTKTNLKVGDLNSNEWIHLAMTWKSGGDIVVYINGNEEFAFQASTNPIGDNMEPFIIGGSPWDQDPLYFGFSGLIDDVGLWNRAFSAQEILNFYNMSK